MTAYQRDDGAEMVEYRPGRTIRRDVGIRLGLIAPKVRIVGVGRPAALAPAADPQPEPVEPPPLQPSHEDLVLVAHEQVGKADDEIGDARGHARGVAPEAVERRTCESAPNARAEDAGVTGGRDPMPPRGREPRPAKRSLADILAEADRTHRALRRKARS